MIEPRDHSDYAGFLSGFTLCLIFVYIFFFSTSFKRTAANRVMEEVVEEDNRDARSGVAANKQPL